MESPVATLGSNSGALWSDETANLKSLNNSACFPQTQRRSAGVYNKTLSTVAVSLIEAKFW